VWDQEQQKPVSGEGDRPEVYKVSRQAKPGEQVRYMWYMQNTGTVPWGEGAELRLSNRAKGDKKQ